MKIVVTANGIDLDAPASSIFGRCPVYVFVDTETMHFEAMGNPEIDTLRGAGFQTAEFVVERGAQAVMTGNVGPNAFSVLQSSGVPVYLAGGGTVREAIAAYETGRLQPVEGANVPVRSGTSGGIGVGTGRVVRMGRYTQDAVFPAPPASPVSREQEITTLKETAGELCVRLAQALVRLEQLEKGD
ncbi:MAG: NifB/NifX family molybdenum-iron cluster-binding protein [Anaerolineae bacterium]|nr:NifB/NifX family molybdenum-iron cluster-binding protein [Anaerolineae bacterium]